MSLDTFTDAYVEALLWASTVGLEPEGEPVQADELWDVADVLADETVGAEIREDCAAFYAECHELWADAWSDEQAGHDFALTRDHHGAGFWDRGQGAIGDQLSDACRPYGSSSEVLYNLPMPGEVTS